MSQEEWVLYMGVMTVETKFEHCEHVTTAKSRAYIAVRGDHVDISYENSNWAPDFLVRTGDVMKGPDAAGVVGHWIRQSGPSDSARAAEAKKNIAQAAYEQFSDRVREALLSQGHDEAKVESILWKNFDASAACQVDALMASAAEQSLSFYELVNMIDPVAGGMSNMELHDSFDQKSFSSRTKFCLKQSDAMLKIDQGKPK